MLGIGQVEQHLKNYKSYVCKYKNLNLDVEELLDVERIFKGELSPMEEFLGPITKNEEELKIEIKNYKDLVDTTDFAIGTLCIEDRLFLRQIYIEDIPMKQLAETYGRITLYKRKDRVLKKIQKYF